MDPQDEKHLIKQVFTETPQLLEQHKQAYLINRDWWDHWCKYSGFYCSHGAPRPGAINNEKLLVGDSFAPDVLDSAVLLNHQN